MGLTDRGLDYYFVSKYEFPAASVKETEGSDIQNKRSALLQKLVDQPLTAPQPVAVLQPVTRGRSRYFGSAFG